MVILNKWSKIMKKEELKKLKEEELKILDYFVEFCNKHKLNYQLTYGTLLGAIRHKGFIPWDDDIDVHMTPKDYLKFLELIKEEVNPEFIVQNIDTEKYYHTFFTKIRKNNTCMVEKEWQYIKIHKGINIDIMPLIPFPDNPKLRKKTMLKLKISGLLLSKNNKTKSIRNKIIFGLLRLIPRKITNKWVSNIITNLLNYDGEYSEYKLEINDKPIKVDWVKKSTLVPFEDREYKIPSKYDEILTYMYGDYMTPPPKKDRTGHGDIILSFNKNYEDIGK